MIPAARDRLSRLQVSWRCCDESGEIQVSEPATADVWKKLPAGVTVRDGQARNGDSKRSRLAHRSFMRRSGGISYFLTANYADFRF